MTGKPNVILIVIDTLRADHLGCYGYFRDTSPVMDRLAGEGILFEDSYANGTPTGPGQTSIITGLAPIHHHFYITPYNLPNLIDFDDGIPTLAELIQDVVGDYTTAAFDNMMNFKSHMDQFARGYEYYVNASRTARPIHHHLIGGELNKRLIPWLKAHADEPFFAFVHYWDPHMPYNQPEEYREIFLHEPGRLDDLHVKKAAGGYSYVPGWGKVGELWEPAPGDSKITVDLYDGEIRYVDHLVGEIMDTLEELDLEARTVVAITSDHGEQLGQHGLYDHEMVHEAVIRVPIILWGPDIIPEGRTYAGYVQQADLAPTVLSLLGAEREELPPFDGSDLLAFVEGKQPPREGIFSEGHHYRALIEGKWKYSRSYFQGLDELYDLESDPMEVINLVDRERERADAMRERLDRWVNENLSGELDPMWAQVSHWAAVWSATLPNEFFDLRIKPYILRGQG